MKKLMTPTVLLPILIEIVIGAAVFRRRFGGRPRPVPDRPLRSLRVNHVGADQGWLDQKWLSCAYPIALLWRGWCGALHCPAAGW